MLTMMTIVVMTMMMITMMMMMMMMMMRMIIPFEGQPVVGPVIIARRRRSLPQAGLRFTIQLIDIILIIFKGLIIFKILILFIIPIFLRAL